MSRTPIDQTDECRGVSAAVGLADKSFSTMRAGLALAGYELHIVTSPETGRGSYMVARWNLHTELPDWPAVVEWAGRAGVQS